jgi:hypothetical protein
METDMDEKQQEFYGKYTFDNLHQYSIEEEYPKLIERIDAERRRNNVIEDSQLIGDITKFLSTCIQLASKYDAVPEIVSSIKDKRTGQPFTLDSYAKYVDRQPVLIAGKTKAIISELGRNFAVVMAKKADMRKRKTEHLPFLWRVAQKLQFTQWSEEEDAYYQKIKSTLHKAAFQINHYRIVEDGEVHMLMSGDNRSGKSGTSIRFMIYSWMDLNKFFKPIIEEQLAAGKYIKMDRTPYRKFEEMVPTKFRLKERMVFLDRKGRLNMLASSPFPDLIYDEGNFTNINLKSMDPESIDETIVSFGARNKHPFVIYNYQNSQRPTLFLREKFNMWMHKIHMKYGFLLIRQRLVVPGKDPWLVAKLDKILATGNEDAIYGFFKHHPYTMHEFKNMRDMLRTIRKRYENMKQMAQIEFYQNKNKEVLLRQGREAIAAEFAEKINDGLMLASSLDEKLSEKGVKSVSEKARIKNLIYEMMTYKTIYSKGETAKK